MIVPIRAGPLFDATENDTFPLPLPDAPLVIVIHESFLTAVQLQVGTVLIENPPVPPLAPIFVLEIDRENEHPEAWLT